MKKFFTSPAIVMSYSLTALLVLLIIGSVTGIFFAHTKLSNYATSVDHARIDTEVNEQNILQAKKLEQTLADKKQDIDKAAAIVADSKYYMYQDQIVTDLNGYAKAADVTVLGFNFLKSSPTTKKTVSTGPKTVTADIMLKSPMPYDNYLTFLKLIENNLTKMQVSQMTVQSDIQNPGQVKVDVITIEVYVR